MKPFQVLIVGAGNIGAQWDKPTSQHILTHAHAFGVNTHFLVHGFVEVDEVKAKLAQNKWGGQIYSSLFEAINTRMPDIVVIATPDETHASLLSQIASFPVKMVVCEKPLTTTLTTANQIRALYTQKKLPLVVNYSRRFLPEFVILSDKIRSGKFGGFLSGTGYYGKGLVHNGSHLIDLLLWFLGRWQKASNIESWIDFSEQDPSVTALLHFPSANFYLKAISQQHFSLFELDLVFEKARIRVLDGGNIIETYFKEPHPIYPDYFQLKKTSTQNVPLHYALPIMVQQIHDFLTQGSPIPSTLVTAYETLTASLSLHKP